jgi:hypothetical protein
MHGGGAENPIPIGNSNSNLKIKFKFQTVAMVAGLSIGESTLTNVAPPPIKVSSPNLISGRKRSADLARTCDLPK